MLNEVASAAIRSANCPIRSLQAWATAAGSTEFIELRNSAALRFAPGASPEGAIIQLARIEACEATMLKSKISTLTPTAPLALRSRLQRTLPDGTRSSRPPHKPGQPVCANAG